MRLCGSELRKTKKPDVVEVDGCTGDHPVRRECKLKSWAELCRFDIVSGAMVGRLKAVLPKEGRND